MKNQLVGSAIALAVLASATPVMADDPNDPAMRSRAVREADAAEVRRLNDEQAAYVQARDAHYAQGWQQQRQDHPQQQSRYARDVQRYEDARADYDAELAAWRDAVRRCRAGDYRFCR